MEEEKERESINWFLIILDIVIGAIVLLAINFITSVDKVYAAETLNSWNGSTQGESCSNCTHLNFGNQRGISTTNYFFTNQGTNVNWTFQHKIKLIKNASNQAVINVNAPTIRLYDGNQGYYDLGANNHCQGTVWRMEQGSLNIIHEYKEYTIGYSCDISNFKVSFPSVSLFQVIYSIDTTASINGYIEEMSFLTTETPYTTQNDYTGTINSVGGNIINNQNQNTTTITNNDNRNTDRIIENQNANSQATIDAIEKQNIKCETLEREVKNKNANKYLNSLGQEINNNGFSTSDYIKIEQNKTYTISPISASTAAYFCLYGEDKSLIQCINNGSQNGNKTFSSGTAYYVRLSKYTSTSTKLNGEYCYNLLEGNTSSIGSNYNKEMQEDYLEAEEDLLDLYNTDQLDIIDLTIDTNGNTWVWDRITQFLNTNQYIRLMFISILSLGIIKLVLAR